MPKRIALSIGISKYEDPNIPDLSNPVSDASLIHKTLTSRGFESELVLDVDGSKLLEALARLQSRVESAAKEKKGAFTVIYFAGHGFESNGLGFLMPAEFPSPVSITRIANQGIPVMKMVEALATCTGPKLIILDACRSDVAEHADSYEIQRFIEISKDLKQKHPAALNADDLVIAFATSPGTEASDGVGDNSRYCKAVSSRMLLHNLSIDELLSQVTQAVIRESGMGQRPWYHSSLTHRVSFSDLAEYRPDPFETFNVICDSTTRLFSLSNGKFIYGAKRKLIEADGHERRTFWVFVEEIKALTVQESDIYVLLESGALIRIRNVQSQIISRVDLVDVNGMVVSACGSSLAVFGLNGYEVFTLQGGRWLTRHTEVFKTSDLYNATFSEGNTLYLCGSYGLALKLNGLLGSKKKLKSYDLKLESYEPLNDIQVLSDIKQFLTISMSGNVRFYDSNTLEELACLNLSSLARNDASGYAAIRNNFLKDAAELLYADPDEFNEKFKDQPCVQAFAEKSKGAQSLICCTLLFDKRVLAVASIEGFVFLIDTRDHQIFRIIDVGGGLGKGLQWMCADKNSNGFVTLLQDGTMVRYTGVMPKF